MGEARHRNANAQGHVGIQLHGEIWRSESPDFFTQQWPLYAAFLFGSVAHLGVSYW